jgi:hypothetical protein
MSKLIFLADTSRILFSAAGFGLPALSFAFLTAFAALALAAFTELAAALFAQTSAAARVALSLFVFFLCHIFLPLFRKNLLENRVFYQKFIRAFSNSRCKTILQFFTSNYQ